MKLVRPNHEDTLRCAARIRSIAIGQCDILLLDNDEPKNYTEAVIGPESERWLNAMRSKLESMRDNLVWNLVDPPNGMRAF